jgi:hypothetical protein
MPVGKTDHRALLDLKLGKGRGESNFFKPRPNQDGTDGRYRVRICPPYTDEMSVPFLTANIHYLAAFGGPKDAPRGVCPGEGCPACEIFWAARGAAKDDTELSKIIRLVQPNTRTFANLVLRDEDNAIRIWSMPYGVTNDLLGMLRTYFEEGIDLTDPEEGRDIIITAIRRGKSHVYGSPTVTPRKTKIGVPGWEDQLHDLHAAAHQTELSIQQIEDYLPTALGEFYDHLKAMTKNADGNAGNAGNNGNGGGAVDYKKLSIADLRVVALDLGIEVKGLRKPALVKAVGEALG